MNKTLKIGVLFGLGLSAGILCVHLLREKEYHYSMNPYYSYDRKANPDLNFNNDWPHWI